MSRFGNRSSATSILQRAQNQLQGKRVPVGGNQQKTEEDDLGAYLNTLTLKTSAQKSTTISKNDIDISDVSMSSNDVKAQPKFSAEASRFLKKKKSPSNTNVQGLSKSMDASPNFRKPTSQSNLRHSANITGSSALNKAAELGRKFDSKQRGQGYRSKVQEKDLSISDDDFGKGGSRFLKKKATAGNSPKGNKISNVTSTPKKSQKQPTLSRAFSISVSDSDEEFMKNLTPISSPDIPPIRDISELEATAMKTKSMSKQAKKNRRKSPSPSRRSPSPILKRRTPSPPLKIYRHDSVETESVASVVDEVEPHLSVSVHDSTISEENFAGVQVLGIEELRIFSPEPEVRFDPTPRMISPEELSDTDSYVRRKAEKRQLRRQSSRERSRKEQSQNIFRAGGARSIESVGSIDQTSDIESEILTQRSVSEIKTRSILSTPRSERFSKSVSIQSEDTYTQDFDSISEKSYSDTFETDRTGSPKGRRSPESRRAAWRNKKRASTYSEDFESYQTDSDVTIDLPEDDSESVSYSESFTSYTDSRTITRSMTPQKKKAKRKSQHNTRDMAVQADDVLLAYQWRRDAGSAVYGSAFGLQYVDPTPIASHVISPDAVEALTSYSPSVLALNDMLRSQIQITQQFVLNSRQIHNSYAAAVESDYQYVTLEDTKEFLHRHRKPRLTFEEALRQVKEEMGMETK